MTVSLSLASAHAEVHRDSARGSASREEQFPCRVCFRGTVESQHEIMLSHVTGYVAAGLKTFEQRIIFVTKTKPKHKLI